MSANFSVRRVARLLCLSLLIAPWCVYAQQPSTTQEPPFPGQERRRDPEEIKREKEMEKARNKERQQSLQKDTDKLFQLATELKQYVDKSNENTLSLDVIKKAEEVEKLAHQVKEKMRGNY